MKGRRILASAVTHDGLTDYNAVVTFTPGELPSVRPFSGEIHSTEHVNAIVHFGDIRPALQTVTPSPALSLPELARRIAPLSGPVTDLAWLIEITPAGLSVTPLT